MTIIETVKKLAQIQTTGGVDAVYAVGANIQAVIKNMHVANAGPDSESISLFHGGSLPSNMILPPVFLGSGEFAMFDGNITMEGADTLYALSSGSTITITLHGIEFS